MYIKAKGIQAKLPAVILLMFLHLQPCFGQEFSDTFRALKVKYPEEQAVYNKYYEDLDISVVADSIVVKSRHYKEMVHLGDQSSMFAKDNIYSSMFYQVDNIKASTLIPHKKKYKSLEVKEFKETFDKNSQVFYDDTKIINFIYPAVEPGVHTVLAYQETITDPRFIGSFLFNSYLPVVHGRYTITLDKGIEVDLKLLHDPQQMVKVKTEKVGSRTRHVYEVFDREKIKRESKTPNPRYYTTHLNLIVRAFTDSKGEQRKVLSSSDDLYGWYRTFIKDLKYQQSEPIKAVVESILEESDTEEEKVKKIFYWVQNNIKYIAFEDGMRGLIPHNGAYVYEKRFGDCKDMASILVNMMQHAGIEAYFTWIGTRDIPYAYSDTPSPLVDNHMIATYVRNGRYYFLDATAQYAPFEFPSSMIQGKEALIALNDSAYQIRKVPEIGRENSVMRDTSYFRMEEGIIKGSGHLSLSGYAKLFNAYRLIKTDEKQVKDYLTRLLSRGSNKFFLDRYKIENLQDLDKPILLDYAFSVADYYKEVGDELYFNMNMDKSFNGDFIDKKRELPIENNFKYTNQSVAVFEIPENYKIGYLPEDNSFSNDVFGYSIRYKPENGKITMHKEFYVNYLLLQPEKFPEYNEAIKKLSDAYSETIILKRTGV